MRSATNKPPGALRIRLTEDLDEGEATVAAFQAPTGRWAIAVHFADAPDQDAIRSLVALATGEEASASGVQFDTVEAKDWVKATLNALVPVHAGRFVVHGQHDRARVAPRSSSASRSRRRSPSAPPMHGTTRGCLLLLGEVLKTYRPRRVLDLGTGTGVLAIAAAKALHGKVLASDIDALSVKIAADNAPAERRRSSGGGDVGQRVFRTLAAATPAVRPDTGQYPRQSAAADGDANVPASRRWGACHPVGVIVGSGAFRDRGLSRAWAYSGAADPDRRLEQPVATQSAVRSLIEVLMVRRSDHRAGPWKTGSLANTGGIRSATSGILRGTAG